MPHTILAKLLDISNSITSIEEDTAKMLATIDQIVTKCKNLEGRVKSIEEATRPTSPNNTPRQSKRDKN